MLRAGATSELCSRVAKARGSPSTRPTKTLNSKRETSSALADRLVDLEPLGGVELTNAHLRRPPSSRRCRAPAARRCPSSGRRTTGRRSPGRPGVNRSPLTMPGTHDQQRDHHEQQQRDADEEQHGVPGVDGVRRVAPELRDVRAGRAAGGEDEAPGEEDDGGTANEVRELRGHGPIVSRIVARLTVGRVVTGCLGAVDMGAMFGFDDTHCDPGHDICEWTYDCTDNQTVGERRRRADRQARWRSSAAAARAGRRALDPAPARRPAGRPRRGRRAARPDEPLRHPRQGRPAGHRPRPGHPDPTGAARQDDGRPAQERDHRPADRGLRHHDPERARRQHRADHRQRRHHRPRARLRRPVAGQGLPVRRLHDLRGPVRRGRRGRRRRGQRHGRGGEPAGHPAARPQRHRLVRPQRRDPAGRQHEPELVARGRRRQRRLPRGPGPGAARAPRGRPRPVGATTTSRTSSSRSRRSPASRCSPPRRSPCGC